MIRYLVGFAVCVLLVACRSDSALSIPEPVCPSKGWTPQRTSDALAAFCSPPGWRQVKASGFWTFAPDSEPQFAHDDHFRISTLTSRDLLGANPLGVPSLLRDPDHPCVHCLDVADYRVHWDTIDGRIVRVEVGRVTGGFVFVEDRPSLMAAWPVTEHAWLLVQGEALNDSTVVTLRTMLGSMRMRPRRAARH